MALAFSANGPPEPEDPTVRPVISPVTDEVIDTIRMSSREDIERLLARQAGTDHEIAPGEVLSFLGRLREQLETRREELVRLTLLETGFIEADSRETVDGAIEFLGDFERHVEELVFRPRTVRHSYRPGSEREIHITHRPYRWVGAIVPQNASLTLGITIIASALYAGSRVLLRPSLQCGSSGARLAEMVEASGPPGDSVLVVNALATDFLEACYPSDDVDLIHYIGSNAYALPVFVRAFTAKKPCLLDGQGNGFLYLDDSFPLDQAVHLITGGATRFNGETCTSVNGVLVSERVYAAARDALVDAFRALRLGPPDGTGSDVGPLFSREQAARLAEMLRSRPHHRVLTGGTASGAYFTPAIVEGVRPDDPLVREGTFGPALWIQPIREDALFDWLRANQFALSDTILSLRPELIRRFAARSRAARICVNADPSIESMFEPWGGYPPSGWNPVSTWIEKYRQTFQLDGPLAALPTGAHPSRSR